MKIKQLLISALFVLLCSFTIEAIYIFSKTLGPFGKQLAVNPYENVNWKTFKQYKAALHVHTLQSDGFNSVAEVVQAYKEAGYSILSITDHDWNYPNFRISRGLLPEEQASPYPKDPKPLNFPANPTWPWTDYGGPKPEDIGMLGIQGNELTFRYHINTYFSDYGVWYERTGNAAPYGNIKDEEGNDIWEDDQLFALNEKKGLAILNHPGIADENRWWERKPLEWYVERYKKHSPDYLVGIEVTNSVNNKYDEGLWDQLLARFMPHRPIWGFGNDDLHRLSKNEETFTVFILDQLTEETVRKAMVQGQFYFCRSNRIIDMQDHQPGVFPVIHSIIVDKEKGTITINASDYEKIIWRSAPESLDTLEDYKTSNEPWQLGKIVHEGETLNIFHTPDIKNYVRAELIRMDDDETYRAFTNPFGIGGLN